MWFALALSLVASASTQGGAAASCPTDAEVDVELARLGVAPGLRPTIAFEGARMQVLLRGKDGAILGSREVDVPTACQDRAVVAAVLVASWMGAWPEGPKAASDGPLPTATVPSPAILAPATSVPSPPSRSEEQRPEAGSPPSLRTLPPTVTAPPPVTAPAAPEPVPVAPLRRRRPTELGLAVLAAYDGNASAVAAALDLRVSIAGALRGFVGLTCSTERDRSVGAGVGGYTIPALELGPALGIERGRLRGELGISARLGLLILRGKDMPSTHATERLIPGMAAQLRLVRVGARFSPYATVVGGWWIGRRTLALDDNAATADLPGWDAQIGLGVLWALGK